MQTRVWLNKTDHCVLFFHLILILGCLCIFGIFLKEQQQNSLYFIITQIELSIFCFFGPIKKKERKRVGGKTKSKRLFTAKAHW